MKYKKINQILVAPKHPIYIYDIKFDIVGIASQSEMLEVRGIIKINNKEYFVGTHKRKMTLINKLDVIFLKTGENL